MKQLLVLLSLFLMAVSSQAADDSMLRVFERVWETARKEIYPATLEEKMTQATHDQLASQAARAKNFEELGEIVNPFLDSLGISHTKFYHSSDPDYFFMRSLFSSGDPDSHPIWHIGLQLNREPLGYRVREVLEKYPAAVAGLRHGDLLTNCDQRPYHPFHCFQSGSSTSIRFLRNGSVHEARVSPVLEAPARSFIQAMKNSVRIFSRGEKRIAYLHFWIGGLDENTSEYDRLIRDELSAFDGLILDLRGGFGGASLERVDHFFPDRSSYPVMSGIDRYGNVLPPETWEPKQNLNFFRKPLVVLINEGVRSGKEMMAFQFKKTGRAKLLGTTTAGMFVGGRMWFSDENENYMLYLASVGALLDGVNLEGVGVSPDLIIEFPLNRTLDRDPQLEAALEQF
jgi:carboxyl-terminal processing protease